MRNPAPELPALSDDDAAQVCIMASLLPTAAALKGEDAALIALHRLRFPANDVLKLGRLALLRAANERAALAGRVPGLTLGPRAACFAAAALAATPAAAHNATLAAAVIPPDNNAVWMTVVTVLLAAALALFGAFVAQIIAIRADILRKKARWDFEDGEEVVTPPPGHPFGRWLASGKRAGR